MWRRSPKRVVAFLLAEICFLQPTLLQATGYDEGQQTGGQFLNQYQNPGALQELLPKVPNYSDASRDQYLSNPYYTQDPNNKSGLSNFERDSAQAINAPQGMTGEVTSTFRARAASPWSWTFGPASTLVSGMQHNLPEGTPIDQGCRPTAYCATPSGTSTTQTCQQTQTVDQAVCEETYSIQNAPGGGQQEVLNDGCSSYKQPPWWPWTSTCQDPPGTAQCVAYTKMIPQSGGLCVDHYLYMRIAQDTPDEVLFQVLDTSPSNVPHWNCDAGGDYGDWHTLSHVQLSQFPGTPTFTLTASGDGCSGPTTTTVTGIGNQALAITCGRSGPQNPTLSWSIPVAAEACHSCWDLKRTFGNSTVTSSTCGPLEAQGCNPSDQRCLTEDCTTVERTYTCHDNTACTDWKDQLVCSACYPDPPGPPRCVDTSYPANGDFLTVAAMSEAHATFATDKDAAVRVFPGNDSRCANNFLVSCCDQGSDAANQIRDKIGMLRMAYTASQAALAGYFLYTDFEYFALVADQSGILTAVSNLRDVVGDFIESVIYDALSDALGEEFSQFIVDWVNPIMMGIEVIFFVIQMLLSCDTSDIETSAKKDLHLCHEVGDYCSIQLLFFCLETTHSYCCFHSILGKIIQEQGRAQLGIGWGRPEQPYCEGLTVQQLAQIDFSKIDLSEYIADLQNRMHWPDASTTASKQNATASAPIGETAQQTIAAAGSLGARVQNDIATPPPKPGTVTLSLIINGSGTINVSPGGSCSATCTLTVSTSTPLSLTAAPAADWSFTGWVGACSGTDPCALTLTAPATVSATFTTTKASLTVVVGSGGTVTSSPAGISCNNATCNHLFDPDTTVTLTATAANASWQFKGWDGDCSGTDPCTLTLNGPHQVSARFYQLAQIVTFSANTTFPVPAGTTITWITTAVNGTPPLQYQYVREDNGNPVLVQDWSTTPTYTWVTNSSSVGQYRVQVLVRSNGNTNPQGAEDWRITDPFTIMPQLQVYGVTPSSGARGATVTVTLSGQSFRSGDMVSVSGSGVTVSGVSVLSDSQIQATFTIDSAATTGSRIITVTDPAGVSATLSNGFTIL